MMTCYDDAMRTIIDLTDEQLEGLKAFCKRKNVSRAEAVRQAVDRLVEEERIREAQRDEARAAVFGMWKDRGVDTDAYLAEIRSEWDR